MKLMASYFIFHKMENAVILSLGGGWQCKRISSDITQLTMITFVQIAYLERVNT